MSIIAVVLLFSLGPASANLYGGHGFASPYGPCGGQPFTLPLPNMLQCLYHRIYNSNSLDRLLILQQRIKHRIEQAKNQIHERHNRTFIDSVLIEIDTELGFK